MLTIKYTSQSKVTSSHAIFWPKKSYKWRLQKIHARLRPKNFEPQRLKKRHA
jgi:hypothetical protein